MVRLVHRPANPLNARPLNAATRRKNSLTAPLRAARLQASQQPPEVVGARQRVSHASWRMKTAGSVQAGRSEDRRGYPRSDCQSNAATMSAAAHTPNAVSVEGFTA